MKTVKIRDILDAIEKNGYPQIRNVYLQTNASGQVTGACAIGQGALNLETDHYTLTNALNEAHQKRRDLATLGRFIIWMNDKQKKSIPEIVAAARERFAGDLDKTVYI
jgi:hypothetical protein